jgi:endonuclease VIII
VPEGDTIFQTAAALRPLLVGQQILAAHARTPGPQIERVIGSHVTAVEPLGKHMLIRFDNDLALHTHLRMGGTWHRYAPGERWRIAAWKARVVLEVPEHVVVCFNAPVAELMEERAVDLHPALLSLGPDLLRDDFDAADAFRRLRSRADAEIAEALVDQRVMAGVGNVFKCEVLFAESVNPWAHVASLSDDKLRAVIATARRLLLDNITPGQPGRVTTRGDPAARGNVWVYGRANSPCRRCGTPIRVRRQGQLNRITYWCPKCQPT